jgi:nucleoside-diphosphate-sugar epimerase
MKRALVLGGCGFVGRHFTRRLLDDDWQVVAVDTLVSGIAPYEWAMGKPVKFSPGQFDWDRRDARWYCHAIRIPEDFDLIIHCAAVVGGRLKINGDPLAVATDLAIDSDFFNWVVKAKNRPKVIYFSSSAVYPIELQTRRQNLALSESLVSQGASRFGRPDMSYGWSKLTGEYLAHLAVTQYNADVVVYRPFSGYGEDQSFDYPFPSIIRRVVNRENPITIWGSGEQCRDFIHIDDIVDAVMETKDVLKPGEVLNLGSGDATSFTQLVLLAARVVGESIGTIRSDDKTSVGFVCDTSKPEGVFYRVADTYKLSQFYKPKISLEEGIRRVAKHLRESHA